MINDNDTIQRCPKDPEHPYTMVSNALIRDITISPNCRWLIIYLLSNKEGWKISIQQIINHCKPHMGRDAVYKIINEAIEAGYMKREYEKQGNLNQSVKYFISETPKFKKSFRHTENQETEDHTTENPSTDTFGRHPDFRDTENPYYKKEQEITKNKQQQATEKNNAAAAFFVDFPLSEEEKQSLKASFTFDQLKRIEKFYKAKTQLDPNFTPNKGWCAFLAAAIHGNWPVPEKLVTSETIRNQIHEKPTITPEEIEKHKQAATKFQSLCNEKALSQHQIAIRENAMEYKNLETQTLHRIDFHEKDFLKKIKELYTLIQKEK